MLFRFLVVAALLLASPVGGQTLAHRNWQGSGLTPEAWWARGIICRLHAPEPRGTGAGELGARLDRLSGMGCDAVETDLAGALGAADAGRAEELGELVGDAGRRRMRVLLGFRVGESSAGASGGDERGLVEGVRFWLTRGVAGFVVRGAAGGGLLRRLRAVTAGAPGARVLMAEALADAGTRGGGGGAQLTLVRLGDLGVGAAARLRVTLSGVGARQGIGLQMDGGGESLARAREAILLLLGPAAVLDAGPMVAAAGDGVSEAMSADGVTEWVRGLADLHHGHPALRTGRVAFFDRDGQDVLAWVVRPSAGNGVPLLVVCNLSGHGLRVALGADLKAMGVRRTYLKTLLRTDAPAIGATLDEIDLAAGGVLVGEVR